MRFHKPYNLLSRHKYILIGLVFYWPAIFIATHMPVPQFVGKMGMTDKTLHYMAYLVLVSLVWWTVSPYERVNWKKAKVWVVLAVVAWYGVADEYLQGFVHRTPDVGDFIADFAAALTGLIILTIFSFWPALLILLGVVFFMMTCLTRFHVVFNNENVNIAFYFLTNAIFALVWVQNIHRYIGTRRMGSKWWIAAMSVPLMFLGATTGYSYFKTQEIWRYDIISALAGIVLAVTISYLTCRWDKEIT